jgi:hypothetical protein
MELKFCIIRRGVDFRWVRYERCGEVLPIRVRRWAIYSNFMRKIGPDGTLPAVFGASVDFGWPALVRGVDFRWVRPSGRAGLAVAWHGG